MSFPIHKYTFFVLVMVLGIWPPGQAAAQEAETVEPMPAERMLESAVTDLKAAMGEALRKNTQIGEKNNALRRDLEQYEKDLAALQTEKEKLLEDQKVLQEALDLQDEDRDALLKELESLRAEGENHDVNRDEKEMQMSIMLEKQKRLQEEAQLLKEEVAFFQKRYQQKSSQAIPRSQEKEKEALETRRDALRKEIDKKREDVLKIQQKISLQKERAGSLKSQKEAWLPRLAEIQNRLSDADRDMGESRQQREAAELKDKAALTELKDDIVRLQDDREQLERAFAEIRDLQEVVRVASRQQEKQAVIFSRGLTEERELLKKKKQALEERLPLQEASASLEQEPLPDSQAASREQLTANIDDLNLALRKGQLKIKACRKKEKLLSKEISSLKADYQKALQRQDSSQSAEEIKEELTRLLSDIDLDDAPEGSAVSGEEEEPRPAPVSGGQKLKREVESLQLREAVLTSSLSIIQARYEEERKAAESFYREETQLNEYLKVLLRENKGLQEKVGGLLKAQDKVDRP